MKQTATTKSKGKARVPLAGLLVLLLAVAAGYWYQTSAPHVRHRGPLLAEPHPSHYFEGVFEEDEINELFSVMRSGPLNMTTSTYMDTRFDNIGEKHPVDPVTGECPSALLSKTKDGQHCIFPERIDVAIHQLMSGGVDARKESYSTAVKRMIIFQKFFQQAEHTMSVDAVNKLFESERYMKHAARICGNNSPTLHPMTLSLLVSLPGQFVGIHIDIPWFMEANRYDFPGWLLAVMQASGLFRDTRIPQVQGVYYLHRWQNSDERRGNFVFWANGTGTNPLFAEASHNNAIICDGTEMAHGTQTYWESAEPAPIDKEHSFTLEYRQPTPDNPNPVDEDPEWLLKRDGEVIRTYRESDLRMTLVWRQHCFDQDGADLEKWISTVENQQSALKALQAHPQHADLLMKKLSDQDLAAALVREDLPAEVKSALQTFHKRMHIDDAMAILEKDLITKKVISQRPTDHTHFMWILIDHYLGYPFARDSWFPYNLCAVEGLLPKFMRPAALAFCA